MQEELYNKLKKRFGNTKKMKLIASFIEMSNGIDETVIKNDEGLTLRDCIYEKAEEYCDVNDLPESEAYNVFFDVSQTIHKAVEKSMMYYKARMEMEINQQEYAMEEFINGLPEGMQDVLYEYGRELNHSFIRNVPKIKTEQTNESAEEKLVQGVIGFCAETFELMLNIMVESGDMLSNEEKTILEAALPEYRSPLRMKLEIHDILLNFFSGKPGGLEFIHGIDELVYNTAYRDKSGLTILEKEMIGFIKENQRKKQTPDQTCLELENKIREYEENRMLSGDIYLSIFNQKEEVFLSRMENQEQADFLRRKMPLIKHAFEKNPCTELNKAIIRIPDSFFHEIYAVIKQSLRVRDFSNKTRMKQISPVKYFADCVQAIGTAEPPIQVPNQSKTTFHSN